MGDVMFTEHKLGLTLESEKDERAGGAPPRTVVKSTHNLAVHTKRIQIGDVLACVNGQSVLHLAFRDVLHILKVASRPICLKFHAAGAATGAGAAGAAAASAPGRATTLESMTSSVDCCSVATCLSAGSASGRLTDLDDCEFTDSNSDDDSSLVSPSFVLPFQPQDDGSGGDDDDDDADSLHAVLSESFGDADSSRTTENSSIFTDTTDSDHKAMRYRSRFLPHFLRMPTRVDGRYGVIIETPEVELVVESPIKAALRVTWHEHPNASSYQIQYSRDWTMRVWKTWSGRMRRAQDNDYQFFTLIYGLEHGKSYIVRLRYNFDRPRWTSEWSNPTTPVLTLAPSRVEAPRMRSRR
ncbi:TPA: hypothetical protein N0F65_009076 [Lagenidium giganteum]|uniref:PDZ domain-containing protein n=1 Tax=Lagenidium giganteum TaxID=4803 RepID=A0AAV2YR48_9STRA|nr:TPA: hypothetical protein N0F65_009076 [Lagenidium giganteum]